MLFAIPTQRKSARPIDFSIFQKDTVRDTILILVYVCMSQVAKHICMYHVAKHVRMYVCLYVVY